MSEQVKRTVLYLLSNVRASTSLAMSEQVNRAVLYLEFSK